MFRFINCGTKTNHITHCGQCIPANKFWHQFLCEVQIWGDLPWSHSIEMPFLPFSHFTPALLVAKSREMYPEADGNYTGFKRKGAEEKMSWKFSYTWNSAICMKYILVWIPSVGRMTELMDSLSSSDDRIGGFPQQVGCWNCQQVDSLSRSEDRIDGFPQQL